MLHLAEFGKLMNHMHSAVVFERAPRRHESDDPADSYLLDLIALAQPEYFVTGDKRSAMLELERLGRTRILSATEFCAQVLRL